MTGDDDNASVACCSSLAGDGSINETGDRQHRGGQQRYKTELCRQFEESGSCRYGLRCRFAHGRAELRCVARHPKYKTDLCRTFHTVGLCPYGQRCHFIHNEDDRRNPADASAFGRCRLEPLRAPPAPLPLNVGVELELEPHLIALALLAFDPAVSIPVSDGRLLQLQHLRGCCGCDLQPCLPAWNGLELVEGRSSSSSKSSGSVASSSRSTSRSASLGDVFNWTSIE